MSSINETGLAALMRKIKSLFFAKQDGVQTSELGIDSTPTSGSTNLVTSGGVFSALSRKVSEPSNEGTSGQVLATNGQGGRTWTTIQGEPTAYIKNASVANEVLTLTKKDNTNVTFSMAEKQNTISDLATIRSGASLGATALQSVPNTYRTAANQDTIDAGKLDKPSGGTTGQVLTKTASGTEWATVGASGIPVEYTIPAGGMKADHLYYINVDSDINIDIEDKFDGYDHEWRLWLYVDYETTPDVSFPEAVYFPGNPDFSNGGLFEISIKRDMYPDSADEPYYIGLFKEIYS